MKKRVFGRKFSRTTNERKLLLRGLMRSFFMYGKMRTTEAKAKAIRGEIEKMVTYAKNKGEMGRVELEKMLPIEVVSHMLVAVAPAFKNRPGGYTRTVRMGNRMKDNAPTVLMSWVEEIPAMSHSVQKEKKKASTKTSPKTTTVESKVTTEKTKTPEKKAKKATVKKAVKKGVK